MSQLSLKTRIKIIEKPNSPTIYSIQKKGICLAHSSWFYIFPILGWAGFLLDLFVWDNIYRYTNGEFDTIEKAQEQIDAFLLRIAAEKQAKKNERKKTVHFVDYP